MIIIGAKGFAKEVLEILSIEMKLPDHEILFFDNINKDLPEMLFGRFRIIRSYKELQVYFEEGKMEFVLGLGNPIQRKKLVDKFETLGGVLTKLVSKNALIGSFNTTIKKGSQIMQGAILTNDIQIGKAVLINLNSSISHDTKIGDYSEIACGVNIAGRCEIGENVFIGTNASIIPDIKIGNNSIIGAGSIVVENVPENVTVVGNPAKIIKQHE